MVTIDASAALHCVFWALVVCLKRLGEAENCDRSPQGVDQLFLSRNRVLLPNFVFISVCPTPW